MVETLPGPGTSLPDILTHRARHTSAERVAIDLMVGVTGISVALVMRPPGWLALLCASACFASFGGWTLCDRGLQRMPAPLAAREFWLRAGRVAFGIVGVASAAMLVLAVLGMVLGPFIS